MTRRNLQRRIGALRPQRLRPGRVQCTLACGILASFAGWSSAVHAGGSTPALPPSVVLLAADDLGTTIGCSGEVRIQTPNLDALAARSVQFETAWVSQASCSSSRSTTLTGRFPHENGQLGLVQAGYELVPSIREATLPAVLARAGYRTGVIGKLHVAPDSAFPFDFREEDVRAARSGTWVAGEVHRFLAEGGERPFFLLVSFSDPHAMRQSSKGSWDFPAQVDGLPARVLPPSEETLFEFQGVDTPAARDRCANYLNAVARLDDAVGRVVRELEAAGALENSLVFFCGDHGPPFVRAKISCYEAGLRIPLLARFPYQTARAVRRSLVSTADLYPTVLTACGIALPAGLPGKALQALVLSDGPWRTHLFAEFNAHGEASFFPRRAVRDSRFALIENLASEKWRPTTSIDGDSLRFDAEAVGEESAVARRAFETFADPPRFELYDLARDPSQLNDLSANPDAQPVLASLAAVLRAWRESTGDPFLDEAALEAHRRRISRPRPSGAEGHDH